VNKEGKPRCRRFVSDSFRFWSTHRDWPPWLNAVWIRLQKD